MNARTLLLPLLVCLTVPGTGCAPKEDFARLMNRGKARLENRDAAGSLAAFQAAVNLRPSSVQAQRNLARSHMLADQLEQAMAVLETAQSLEQQSAATRYLIGLVHARKGRAEEALPHFEEAVRLDPHTAALRFQLASAYQLTGQTDQARVQWEETVRLDPLHASAYFKLAMLARQAGDPLTFKQHNDSFTHLQKVLGDDQRTPTALERCVYTRPEAIPDPVPLPDPGIAVRYANDTADFLADTLPHPISTSVVLDRDDAGQIQLLLVQENGKAHWLTLEAPDHTPAQPQAIHNLNLRTGPYHAALAGNFHDLVPAGAKYDPTLHAMTDVLLVGTNGVALLQRTGPQTLSNVTEQAGLSQVRARAAAWGDYDHDGDLDLALANLTGLQLWQNTGNGRFTNITSETGITNPSVAVDLTMVDLDLNQGIDLLTAATPASHVFMNQRLGIFKSQPQPPGPGPGARLVLSDDFNNDGHLDILWLRDKELTIQPGKQPGLHSVPLTSILPRHAVRLDFDNDGWLDLCVVGHRVNDPTQGAVSLYRNQGGLSWSDVSETSELTRLTFPPLAQVLSADLDVDGDTDLLVTDITGQLHFLRNHGGNAHQQLKLGLLGGKTNPSGIGTQLEIRSQSFHVTRSVTGLPLEIGLASHHRLDSIKTIWTNGIEDNQIDVAPGQQPILITEANVASGSCPYLYAWDGRKFRFITDLLGNSPLGLSLNRDRVLPADPEEVVWLGNDQTLKPRDGFIEVAVTEELREVLYLDQTKIMVVDHPEHSEVHSNDKLGPPPYAPARLETVRVIATPLKAMGDDQIDRTRQLQSIDGNFAPPGLALPPPFRGQCHPLTLTLDFGTIDHAQSFILALTGWLQYGDASVNIAASQNQSLPVIPPRLEAQTADGSWSLITDALGMPAGKTKTILFDLRDKLPPGTRQLRLSTTFEIRWDRIALCQPVDDPSSQTHEIVPATAHLAWRGYSEIKARSPGHPATPDYDRVLPAPPWQTTPQGWCTRYGDVLELVTQRDDELVLLNGGDALRLRFATKELPPVAPGQTRSYFFYSVGWDKDMDSNVVDGHTVEPLPVVKKAAWFNKFNTRWVP